MGFHITANGNPRWISGIRTLRAAVGAMNRARAAGLQSVIILAERTRLPAYLQPASPIILREGDIDLLLMRGYGSRGANAVLDYIDRGMAD